MENILQKINKNYTFISLTGYRILLIFNLLLTKPRTIDEIKQELLKDSYAKGNLSDDTIRTYINSLRSMGCEISKATKLSKNQFVMTSNPLCFDFKKQYLKVFKKAFDFFQDCDSVDKLEYLEAFAIKLIKSINNPDIQETLYGLLIINKIDKDIYKLLKHCCQNKFCTGLYYKSARTGKQEIEFICDKMFIKSGMLYIAGYNLKHKEYSSLLVNRVKRIISIKPMANSFFNSGKSVICEIYDKNYIIDPGDELIKEEDNKLIIKMNGTDEFRTVQKIMYLADSCKVINPVSIKTKIKKMIEETRKQYD